MASSKETSSLILDVTDLNIDNPNLNKDKANANSCVVTLEPFTVSSELPKAPILYIESLPLSWSFYDVHEEFSRFGRVKEIRNRLCRNFRSFETWIIFHDVKDALKASIEFKSIDVKRLIVDTFPRYLDLYRPPVQTEGIEDKEILTRTPHPPRWLIITTNNERGNLFKVKKLINQKVGHVLRPDITRFGRNSFLVCATTDGQAAMLLNMRLDPKGLIKAVKPHYNFSYAKGVIFSEDIYELEDDEILDLCPKEVWKIFKVPRSSMIITTFINADLPNEIVLDSEIMRVCPYRPRVLQCFNCFGFGHSAKICTRKKICERCGQAEHEDCSRSLTCANCKGDHQARDKECVMLKKEQEALLKSVTEHISVGYAKKLLSKGTYSDALKRQKVNSSSGNEFINDAGSSRASSGGSAGTSGASFWGALGVSLASSGGSRSSLGGPSPGPSGGAHKNKNNINEAPRASSGETSLDPGTQSKSRSRVGSETPTSLKELDQFFLPDIEDSSNEIVVTVHHADDGEEMEALSVRQKRPRTPSPHSSSSSNHGGHAFKASDKKMATKFDKSGDNHSSSKSSLPRPLKREKVVLNKKATKSK